MLAAAAICFSQDGNLPGWITLLLLVFGLAMLGAAMFSLLDWASFVVIMRLSDANEAMAITERVKILEFIQRMTVAQISAINQYMPSIEYIIGNTGPAKNLRVKQGLIPYTFVDEFVQNGNEEYLAPVGLWSDGTDARLYAQWITQTLVSLGYAKEAAGNNSAKWVDVRAALIAIGYTESGSDE
jgi:hypothetical protein